MKKIIRTLKQNEVWKLKRCIQELAEHHNTVSVNFKGNFPRRPYEVTLESFEKSLKNETSKIAVMEENEQIAGFCKVDFHGTTGKLDYLVVLKEYRGNGYGKQLMDWAMQEFETNGIKQIEVKVVDGNEAIHLYEKYGFKMNAHILVRD